MADNMTAREQLKTIAQQWVEAGWQKGDAAAVYAMYTPEFVDVSSPTGYLGTRDDNIEGIIGLYTAFPDFYATVDDLVLDVETEKVAVRWTATGTHRGTFLGAAATGKRVLFHGIETLHISNGRIVERVGEWDEGNILRQLGVLPEEQSQG